jgi:hypothetical protein
MRAPPAVTSSQVTSFVGMFVRRCRMFVPCFAVLVSSLGMPFRLIFLAKFVMMSGLMMMMRGCVMISGGLVTMLNGGMLRRFCHGAFLRNQ